MLIRIPDSTTQDMKWGIYNTVCDTLVKRFFLISFSIMAIAMGIGNPHSSLSILIQRELRNTWRKFSDLKSSLKFSSPTNSLPEIPATGRNF